MKKRRLIEKSNAFLLKAKPIATWLTKELISGLVVAAAIAIATIWISNHQALRREQEDLKTLHLGLARKYVESIFSIPVVDFYDELSRTEVAYYKLTNSVVKCDFVDNEVVAFFIIVKSQSKLYEVSPNILLANSAYLTHFSYSDFSSTPENPSINTPVNNDDYAYYSERYYGAGPADYNYFVLGSYKNYFDADVFGELLSCQWSDNTLDDISIIRSEAKPNAYGMIALGYEDSISLVSFSENMRIYGDILFGDWYTS